MVGSQSVPLMMPQEVAAFLAQESSYQMTDLSQSMDGSQGGDQGQWVVDDQGIERSPSPVSSVTQPSTQVDLPPLRA